MKRVSLVLVIVMILSMVPVYGADGMDNFKVIREYTEGQFTDVKENQWYTDNIATAYRMGLVNGASDTSFNLTGSVTLAETIAMACRLNTTYYGKEPVAAGTGSKWYEPYVEYAINNGIISGPYADYNRKATRAQYASILYKAMPLTEINDIPDGAIKDVAISASYGPAVYGLYRAGILTGYNDGTYKPASNIVRNEIATVVTRMADKSARVEFTVSKDNASLSAVDVAKNAESAVFYIEVYGADGYPIQSGSGFFIDKSGVAVTNYHVIDGGSSAVITMADGTTHNVLGVYDYSVSGDIALLQIEGSNFKALQIGDSKNIATGETVYALGSPIGLDNTFSQGIISNTHRLWEGIVYIQITAPISHGSSGGALLDANGKVIGITSAGFDEAQNLNMAIPIDNISTLQREEYVPLSTIANNNYDARYDGYIWVDSNYASINKGGETVITAWTLTEGVTFTYYIYDKSVCSCSWGEWTYDDGVYFIDLTIKGDNVGETDIELYLDDPNDDSRYIDKEIVNVSVCNEIEVTATNYAPVVNLGRTLPVTISHNYDGEVTIYYTVGDESICTCSWGEWKDWYHLPLYIKGNKKGSTTVMIDIYDDYGIYCDTIFLYVMVK